jgi:hypothetical protein
MDGGREGGREGGLVRGAACPISISSAARRRRRRRRLVAIGDPSPLPAALQLAAAIRRAERAASRAAAGDGGDGRDPLAELLDRAGPLPLDSQSLRSPNSSSVAAAAAAAISVGGGEAGELWARGREREGGLGGGERDGGSKKVRGGRLGGGGREGVGGRGGGERESESESEREREHWARRLAAVCRSRTASGADSLGLRRHLRQAYSGPLKCWVHPSQP